MQKAWELSRIAPNVSFLSVNLNEMYPMCPKYKEDLPQLKVDEPVSL